MSEFLISESTIADFRFFDGRKTWKIGIYLCDQAFKSEKNSFIISEANLKCIYLEKKTVINAGV